MIEANASQPVQTVSGGPCLIQRDNIFQNTGCSDSTTYVGMASGLRIMFPSRLIDTLR